MNSHNKNAQRVGWATAIILVVNMLYAILTGNTKLLPATAMIVCCAIIYVLSVVAVHPMVRRFWGFVLGFIAGVIFIVVFVLLLQDFTLDVIFVLTHPDLWL